MLVQGRSGERIRWPAWSADRRVLFYVNEDPATQLSRVLTRDLRSGRVKEIYRAPLSALSFNRGNSMVLSPDGRYLAFSQSGVVMILPTAGGDRKSVV